MSAKEPKSIQSVLQQQNSALASLSELAQQNRTLAEQVQQSLPVALRDSILAANIDGAKLTLVCTSAPWAVRLRFYSETLMQNLGTDHKIEVKTIKIKVRPARTQSSEL